MQEIDPKQTNRAKAFELWMKAPMPMVTMHKSYDITHLRSVARKRGLKLNMLMCYCILRAADRIKEFYILPVGDKLMQFDRLAINTIVMTPTGGINTCDIPYIKDLDVFGHFLPMLFLKVTTDLLENLLVEHQLSAKCLGNGLLGQIIIGRPKSAGRDDDIGAVSGDLQSFLEPPGVIPHDRVVMHGNTKGAQSLGDHLRVGVGDAAQQQLRTDGDQFSGVRHDYSPCSNSMAMRSTPSSARFTSASMSRTDSYSMTSLRWGCVLG